MVDGAIKAAETAAESRRRLESLSADPAVEVMAAAESPSPSTAERPNSRVAVAGAPQRARRRRRIERFEQIHERHRQATWLVGSPRELGMSTNTVPRYLRCKAPPDWKPGREMALPVWTSTGNGSSARIAEGDTNASYLYRQLKARGFHGSYSSVQRYVREQGGWGQQGVKPCEACQRSEAI